ncbi:MAG: glycosyltransferase family 2 protein [Planctomycetota bacterium]
MTAAPAVSVVLPVRNAEATLGSALRSIQRQAWRDFECLVVDDGSSDGSPAIVAEWARRDARFRRLAVAGSGVAAAAMTGVAAARAPLIARMDADDVMHRRRLTRQVAALLDASLAGVGTHVRFFPRGAVGPGMARYEAWLNSLRHADDVARDRFVECPLANPSLMLRRDVLLQYPWRACGWPEDYDLILRLHDAGARLGVLPQRLHGWRHGPGRLTTDHPDYALSRFVACKAHYLASGWLGARRRYVLWGYGSTGRALRAALLEEGRAPSHIVELHPGRVGNRIHGAPVVRPEALRDPGLRPVVVSVAGAVARERIRAVVGAMGLVEGVDFVCAA